MTWTYNPESITTNLAKVRLMVGDTDEADQQATDEEIQFFIDTEANIYMAGSKTANVLASFYTRQVDKEMGDLKILASQRARAYERLSKSLASRGISGSPTAGGLIVTEKAALSDDTARVQPSFSRGLHEHP